MVRKGTIIIADDVPEDLETMKDSVLDILSCPACFYEEGHPLTRISLLLLKAWLDIVEEYQVGDESLYIEDEFGVNLGIELVSDYEELKAVLLNSRGWVPQARAKFYEYFQLFETRMADESIYPKHYPQSKLSKKELLDRSRNGVALLYPGIRAECLNSLLFELFEDYFLDLWGLKKPSIRFGVECLCPVGVSRGHETSLLCVEINKASKIAHCYPITKEDKTIDVAASSDVLQGYAYID